MGSRDLGRVETQAALAVAIVGRDSLYLRALAQALRDADRFEHPLMAPRPDDLMVLLRRACPDLIVVGDPAMMNLPGLAALRDACPDAHLILHGFPSSLRELDQLYRRGVRGFISPKLTWWETKTGLTLAAAGHVFVPRWVLDRAGAQARGAGPDPLEGLTARELEVLELVAAGRSNKSIAGELWISISTVKTHVHSILGKLDAPGRAAAGAVFRSRREVRSDE